MKTLIAILLAMSLSCQAADQRPQAIESHDVCAACKMAISQPRYAAQIVDKEGTAHKFDDIGCMANFARQRKLTQAAGAKFYVMNYAGNDWLEAEKAVFVRSDAIESPMASGLAAFRDQPSAQKILNGNSGQIVTFDDVMQGKTKRAQPVH